MGRLSSRWRPSGLLKAQRLATPSIPKAWNRTPYGLHLCPSTFSSVAFFCIDPFDEPTQ